MAGNGVYVKVIHAENGFIVSWSDTERDFYRHKALDTKVFPEVPKTCPRYSVERARLTCRELEPVLQHIASRLINGRDEDLKYKFKVRLEVRSDSGFPESSFNTEKQDGV